MCFRYGATVNSTCEKIVLQQLNVDNFPRIRIFIKNNRHFSLDNRRLYMFRVLENLGVLETITVRMTDRIGHREVTTENEGCHVKLRNKAVTYKHCSCFFTYDYPDWWDSSYRCHRNKVHVTLLRTPSRLRDVDSMGHRKINNSYNNIEAESYDFVQNEANRVQRYLTAQAAHQQDMSASQFFCMVMLCIIIFIIVCFIFILLTRSI
ncbi:unnamed protein product [Clavelina lepadiformis]|uniref:Uncharacterized protein n=1 Tax=Clavelina lepadiformis TaxID=159417 RepID=A0ABP0FH90_CLALP